MKDRRGRGLVSTLAMKPPRKTWISANAFVTGIALVMALAVVFAPVSTGLARAGNALSCTPACEKSCADCHAGMPCCRVSAPMSGAEPIRSASVSGVQTGSSAILAIASKSLPLLYVLPPVREDFSACMEVVPAPVPASLEQLCVRLI